MEKIVDRFLRYVAFDTTSNPDSQSQPSTNKQFALLEQLRKELVAMGLENVVLDKYGYLMASIPSNIEEDVPAIGFISHVDTSPDAPGSGIKPRIIENYDGKAITLNEAKGMVLDPEEFPELKDYVGQTLITTVGNTLLGAGDKLPVVTEIMAQAASFKSGADLEKDLAAAPTGYNFGTVFSTLAALFRANKVIVKYNNQEFHSWQQDGAREPFTNSRNFQRASFKAVTQNLTYAEKRKIVDTLKDCDYKKLTGENVSYNMNDFELVESIRTLSQTEIGKVNNKTCGNSDLERIFHGSLAAADELRKYSGSVTEYNYFNTARNFLQEDNNDAFCDAVEKIEADVRFIDTNYSTIEEQKRYFAAVKVEMEFVGVPMQAFDQISERYSQLLESDPVRNFQQMLTECQKLKDLYYQYMDDRTKQMSTGYADLHAQLEAVKAKADQYPHDWNSELYSQIDAMEAECKRYAIGRVKLDDYSTRCSVSHLQLRDIVAAINMLPQRKVDVVVMSTSVKTSAPTPPPKPDDPKPKPQPTKRKLHDQLPTGTLSVSQYRQWLTQQLTMVNQYGATDILEFDE